jgi:hypothetical protein
VGLLRALLVLILALAVPAAAHGQEPRLDDARARWERLSPEQRRELRERFERFRAMEPDQRGRIEERARRLREGMERAEARLTDEQCAKLAGLDPQRRDEVLRELAMLDGHDRGERFRGALPPEWRERLEQVPAEERGRVFEEIRGRMRERMASEAAQRYGAKLGLSAEEIARIQAQPEPERLKAVMDLRERAFPKGLERPEMTPERAAALRKLGEASRPRAEDVLRFAELPAQQRRAHVQNLVRARVLTALRESGLVTPERMAELEKAGPEQVHAALRELMPRWGGRGPGEHGERGPGRHGPGEHRPGEHGPPPDGLCPPPGEHGTPPDDFGPPRGGREHEHDGQRPPPPPDGRGSGEPHEHGPGSRGPGRFN